MSSNGFELTITICAAFLAFISFWSYVRLNLLQKRYLRNQNYFTLLKEISSGYDNKTLKTNKLVTQIAQMYELESYPEKITQSVQFLIRLKNEWSQNEKLVQETQKAIEHLQALPLPVCTILLIKKFPWIKVEF